MKFKLLMLSLLSLSIYSAVYSMDLPLSEAQIQQVVERQNQQNAMAKKKVNNERLAKLIGLVTTVGAYKLIPVESFFEKYKEVNPEWARWNRIGNDPISALFMLFCFPLLIAHSLSQPDKFIYRPESIQNTIYALKALKGIGSLYAGYQAYKLVRNKLNAPANVPADNSNKS
jgi:hypothetical protein